MLCVMRRIILPVSLLLVGGVLAGCGGGGGGPSTAPSSPASISQPAAGGAQPSEAAPGLSGLERAIAAAHATVTKSQQDAQRASATSAGQ
jgi:hypothetical protein